MEQDKSQDKPQDKTVDKTVVNQLNKLIESFIVSKKELVKGYPRVRDQLDGQFDKTVAVSYMDRLDSKKTVMAIYDSHMATLKYDMLALHNTVSDVEDMILEIEEILSNESDEESESSRSYSSRRDRRRREDKDRRRD